MLNRAYHAAVLDTDGSVFISSRGVATYDLEQVGAKWVEQLYDEVGFGRVTYRRGRTPNANPTAMWRITKKEELLSYLILIEPYARKKRNEIKVVIQYLCDIITTGEARARLKTIRASYGAEVERRM